MVQGLQGIVDVESHNVSGTNAVDSLDASVPGTRRQATLRMQRKQAITGLQSAILLRGPRSPQLPQAKLARTTLITIQVCNKHFEPVLVCCGFTVGSCKEAVR